MTASQNEKPDISSPAENAAPAEETAAEARPETAQAPDPLAEALAQAEENRNNYLRVAAELENQRKRAQRDLEQAHKFAIERFAGELLAVKDSLEMGLAAAQEAKAEDTVATLLEGKAMTLKQLSGAFEKFGIEEINPAGGPFDPALHEAMATVPSAEQAPGTVLTVVQKGYTLNGRLLRPARVLVARENDPE